MPFRTAQEPLGSAISPEGGLFHDPDTFPGTEAFNLYGPDGRRIGRWYAIEGATDPGLIEAFLDFLARRQPQLTLLSSVARAS